MELDEILIFLKEENTRWDSRSPKYVELPFGIKPNEYLRFAEIDLAIKKFMF